VQAVRGDRSGTGGVKKVGMLGPRYTETWNMQLILTA
jgi:hypothetical protein